MPIKPSYWGEAMWKTMYSIAYNYPEKNPSWNHRQAVLNFMNSLKTLIPCDECREEYIKDLKKNPLTHKATNTRAELMKWVNTMQNATQTRLGRPAVSLKSVESEVEKHWVESRPKPVPKASASAVSSDSYQVVKHQVNHKLNTDHSKPMTKATPTVKSTPKAPKKGGCGCGRR